MSEELDLSGAIEQIQQMLSDKEGETQLQNLIGMLTGGGSLDAEEGGQPPSGSDGFGPAELLSGLGDIETIMKIKNVMSALGSQKNDANISFLNSLKPFLKKERRQKLEQAAKMMSVAKAIKLFKDLGIGGV